MLHVSLQEYRKYVEVELALSVGISNSFEILNFGACLHVESVGSSITSNLTWAMSQQFHDRYNFDDGDLTLLTSDNVKFRVHSAVLKVGSGVFRDMLELARPDTQNPSEPISLSETSATLERVFQFLYPADATLLKPATFKGAQDLCEIAIKYDMPLALSGMRLVILGTREYYIDDSIDVYIYACKHGWDDVADVASAATLTTGLSNERVMKKLKALNGPDLYNLINLHTRRKKQIVDSIRALEDDDRNLPMTLPHSLNCMCYDEGDGSSVGETPQVFEALRDAVAGVLDRRPIGDTVVDIFDSWIFKTLQTTTCGGCRKIAFDTKVIMVDITKALNEAVSRISDLED